MRNIVEKWLLPVLIFLHVAIALPFAYYLNIWVDEASTLQTTQNGLVIAFRGLFANEKQAPLYFLLLSVWRSIDHSFFFARAFSIICSGLAIAVFWRLACRLWSGRLPLLITALFALHPYLFWASLEIRLYSFIILLTCLLLLFFVDGFMTEPTEESGGMGRQNRAQYLYAATSVAAVYTNYYLGFPLVGGFVALIILRQWKAAKAYFFLMLGVGVAILPLFYIIQIQFSERAAAFQENKSVADALRIVWNHVLTFTLPTEIYTEEASSTISVVRLWLVRLGIVIALILMIRDRKQFLESRFIAFVTISAVSVAFFFFVYAQLGSDYLQIRHAAVYFVLIFVVACMVMSRILSEGLQFPVAAIVLSFYVYSGFALYPAFTKRGDWDRVSTYIRQNESSGQPAIVFPVYDTVALSQYYKGQNIVLPDEKTFSFVPEGSVGSPDVYARQIEFVISEIPADAHEIWLLTSDKCDVKLTCLPLENFVEANYTVIQEREFYKERVRLLRKNAQ